VDRGPIFFFAVMPAQAGIHVDPDSSDEEQNQDGFPPFDELRTGFCGNDVAL
jgi:hypothetical protein